MFLVVSYGVNWSQYLFSSHSLFQKANIGFRVQYGSRSGSYKHIPPRVGLPSSGLCACLQNAGGESSTPGGLPNESMKAQPEKDGEYCWEFSPSSPQQKIPFIPTRRVQNHPKCNKAYWRFQKDHLHFFWDDGLHSGQLEETGSSTG